MTERCDSVESERFSPDTAPEAEAGEDTGGGVSSSRYTIIVQKSRVHQSRQSQPPAAANMPLHYVYPGGHLPHLLLDALEAFLMDPIPLYEGSWSFVLLLGDRIEILVC